jgi:ABC-2 type transport system ATP-binding protein
MVKVKSAHAIRLDGLTKRYGTAAVVNHLTLDIPRGTIFGFIGPNGSGKSTTIKMMTGLVTPDEGDAFILGHSVRNDGMAVKLAIGVVPDGLALFEHLSIWEHLELVRAAFDLDLTECGRRSSQLLQLLELSADSNRLAKHCSYGMRKKTALAMALLSNPKVLILDEPFEGLDPLMTVTVKRALSRAAQGGVTVFITTHVLAVVGDLIEQYGIIKAGILVAQGDKETLRRDGLSLEEAYLREFEIPKGAELEWLG